MTGLKRWEWWQREPEGTEQHFVMERVCSEGGVREGSVRMTWVSGLVIGGGGRPERNRFGENICLYLPLAPLHLVTWAWGQGFFRIMPLWGEHRPCLLRLRNSSIPQQLPSQG